ncbi:MAG: class II fructose-bisphosphatase [Rickettsiales bacterium]|nr:class II fructose-bisphosphatase [Rickettsiales bacterium]
MKQVNIEFSDEYKKDGNLNRNFALEAVRVTEFAALSCSSWIGKGEKEAADQAAVNAMRDSLNTMDIDGTIVIGEGERDKAPMLYIGEKVGTGNGPAIDIALDPLEGTDLCATGSPNSLTVIAFAQKGCFLHAPDVYMDKIAVGNGLPEGVIDLDNSPERNLKNLAKARNCEISDLTAVILNRKRHEELIAKVREAGARINLITDGDVAGIISTAIPNPTADIYFGTGGAPEGVLAAAALRATGGQMQGRLIFNNDQAQIDRAKKMGIIDLSKKYAHTEMAKGDVMFAATGVTDGFMLQGVKHRKGRNITHSIVMRSATRTVRQITTEQNLKS